MLINTSLALGLSISYNNSARSYDQAAYFYEETLILLYFKKISIMTFFRKNNKEHIMNKEEENRQEAKRRARKTAEKSAKLLRKHSQPDGKDVIPDKDLENRIEDALIEPFTEQVKEEEDTKERDDKGPNPVI